MTTFKLLKKKLPTLTNSKTRKKIICLLVLINFILAPLGQQATALPPVVTTSNEKFTQVPYFSDPELQEELINITLDQIYGNNNIEGDSETVSRRNDIARIYGSVVDYSGVKKNIVGVNDLFKDSQQIAATIENDAIAIIKDSSRDNSEELQELLNKIYSKDASNPGILDHIIASYDSWTPEEKAYYKQQAQIKVSLEQKISDLISGINSVDLNDTDLTNDNPREGEDGFTSGPIPEYSIASRDLQLVATNDLSYITGKDRAFWTDGPTNSYSLMDVVADYRVLTYMRAKVIMEKYQTQREAQLQAAENLHKEVNDIIGYVSPSPYDMQSIVQATKSKIYITLALASPLSGAATSDDGFNGVSEPQVSTPWLFDATTDPPQTPPDVSDIEPVNWGKYDTFLTEIQTQYETAVKAVDKYQKKYEGSPNLNNGGTYSAFETASIELTKLKDQLLTTLNSLSSDINKRVSESDIQISNFDDMLGSILSAQTASSGIWSELRDAMVNNVTWMLSQFGKLLNFGIDEIKNQTSLYQMHQIILTIANLGFVLIIAMAGLAISMEWNVSAYNLKVMLPRFLASIILVNSALLIAQFFTDLSLITTNLFLTQAKDMTGSTFSNEIFARAGGSQSTLGLSSGASNLLFGGIISTNLTASANTIFANDLASIMILGLIFFVTTMVNLMLVIRTAGIWLLIIISPIIYLIWTLPSTTSIMYNWWKWFLTLVFLGPIIAIIFLIGVSLGTIGFADDFLRVLIGVGTFGLMLTAPNALSSIAVGVGNLKNTDKEPPPPPRDYPKTPKPGSPNSPSESNKTPLPGNSSETSRQLLKNLVSSDSLKQLISKEHQQSKVTPSKKPNLQDVLSQKKSTSKTDKLNQLMSPTGQVVINLINSEDWTGLISRVKTMMAEGEVKVQTIKPIIDNEKGLEFLGNSILTGKPEASTAKQIINNYYTQDPQVLATLANQIKGKSSLDAQPLIEIAKIGLDPLGAQLQQNPENTELQQTAKQIVTTIPEYIADLSSGGPDRQVAIAAGIKGEKNADELSASVVAQLQANDLQTLPAEIAVTGISKLAEKNPQALKGYHIDSIIDSATQDEKFKPALEAVVTKLHADSQNIGTEGHLSAEVAAKIVGAESQLQTMNIALNPEIKEKIQVKAEIQTDNISTQNAQAKASITPTSIGEVTIPEIKAEKATTKQTTPAESSPIQSADALLNELKQAQVPDKKSPPQENILDKNNQKLTQQTPNLQDKPIEAKENTIAKDLQFSPLELFALVQGDINNVTADTLEGIFSQSLSQQERYRGAIQSIVSAYNEHADQLSDSVKDSLQKHKAELDVMGAPLAKEPIQPQKSQQLMGLLNQTPEGKLSSIPGNLFADSLSAMLQSAPQFIQANHLAEAINRLDTDQATFIPMVASLLAPGAQISTQALSQGVATLASSHPEQIRPEHINQILQNPSEFKEAAAAITQAFNNSNGKVGIEGTLRKDTAAALVNGKAALASQNLSLSPYQNSELNGEVVAQTSGQDVNKIDDQTFYDGMGNLATSNSQAILPEHIARTIQGLQSGQTQAQPVMTEVANRFNESDINQTNQPLSSENQFILAAQAESLQGANIQLDQTALENVFSQALKKGVDVKGMNTLEEAVRDLPRQLSKAPGKGSNNAVMAAAAPVSAASAGAAADQTELSRESVNNESASIMKKASQAHEELDLSEDSDLSAYAANVKVDGQKDVVTPKLILAEEMPDLSKEDF